MKLENVIPSLIIGVSLVAVALIFQAKRADMPHKGMIQLVAHEGALYKIHTGTGQTKVLVPADNAVGFVDVADINFENEQAMKDNMKAVSQYIRSERARNLAAQGLKEDFSPPKEE